MCIISIEDYSGRQARTLALWEIKNLLWSYKQKQNRKLFGPVFDKWTGRVCLVITYIFDCSGKYKEKKGMMMVVFWSKATRVSGHQLHVCTSQKPFSLRGIHKLKLRWFVIFWSLHCPVQWPSIVLFILIICYEAKHCRAIGQNNVITKISQIT